MEFITEKPGHHEDRFVLSQINELVAYSWIQNNDSAYLCKLFDYVAKLAIGIRTAVVLSNILLKYSVSFLHISLTPYLIKL